MSLKYIPLIFMISLFSLIIVVNSLLPNFKDEIQLNNLSFEGLKKIEKILNDLDNI